MGFKFNPFTGNLDKVIESSGSSSAVGTQTETFEESAALDPTTASGFQWGVGNGDEITQNGGVVALFDGNITDLGLFIFEGSATVELYINGSATTLTVSASGTDASSIQTISRSVSKGDLINFRTTAATGNTNGGNVGFKLVSNVAPAAGYTVGGADDVDIAGIQDGEILIWNSTDGEFQAGTASAGLTEDEVVDIASGLDIIAADSMSAASGQPAATTSFVSFPPNASFNPNVYVASLADFNNIFVNDVFVGSFNRGETHEYVGTQGDKITSEKGHSGTYSIEGGSERPVELATAAAAGRQFFWFAFRSQPHRHVVQALALSSRVRVYGPNPTVNADGTSPDTPIQDTTLAPFTFLDFTTPTNGEYYILASQPVVTTTTNQNANQDQRVLAPLTNEIFGHTAGVGAGDVRISALFSNTTVQVWQSDGSGPFTGTSSPGSPLSLQGNDGSPINLGNDDSYNQNGWLIIRADGPIAGFSGADEAGTNATTFPPLSAASQVVGLSLGVTGTDNSAGVMVCSEHEGNVTLFQDDGTVVATRQILRRGSLTTPAPDQTTQGFPAAAEFVNVGTLNRGAYLIADVPIYVVANFNEGNNSRADDDETSCFGITPEVIKAEIREDANGIRRRRTIDGSGVETWEIC